MEFGPKVMLPVATISRPAKKLLQGSVAVCSRVRLVEKGFILHCIAVSMSVTLKTRCNLRRNRWLYEWSWE